MLELMNIKNFVVIHTTYQGNIEHIECYGNYDVNLRNLDWKNEGISCIKNSSEPLLTHIENVYYTQKVKSINYNYINNNRKLYRRARIEPATKATKKTKNTDVIIFQYSIANIV